jgi:hypothetical protein
MAQVKWMWRLELVALLAWRQLHKEKERERAAVVVCYWWVLLSSDKHTICLEDRQIAHYYLKSTKYYLWETDSQSTSSSLLFQFTFSLALFQLPCIVEGDTTTTKCIFVLSSVFTGFWVANNITFVSFFPCRKLPPHFDLYKLLPTNPT